jgi:L-lactate dehydrogenase complex protein LldG
MSAREEVLGRVRAAIAKAPSEDRPIPRGYARSRDLRDLVGLFVERVEDYRADVHRCGEADVAGVVAGLVADGARLAVPDGFPAEYLPESVVAVGDPPDAPLSAASLDELDGVVTTAAVGIAVTGTIVLDHGPGQGRRALSLVPDLHVCVVRVDQIVDDVPAAIARLDPRRVLTWISGPSATSDIELDRVEGVHGPRTLRVVVVG